MVSKAPAQSCNAQKREKEREREREREIEKDIEREREREKEEREKKRKTGEPDKPDNKPLHQPTLPNFFSKFACMHNLHKKCRGN